MRRQELNSEWEDWPLVTFQGYIYYDACEAIKFFCFLRASGYLDVANDADLGRSNDNDNDG